MAKMSALSFLWQLPQHILALILIIVCKTRIRDEGNLTIWYKLEQGSVFSGMSLGEYILLKRYDEATYKHEEGHSRQSRLLGPLYLLVVGVYSALFCNLWDRIFHRKWQWYDRVYWYYKTRWTERWADKMGGVDRDVWISQNYQYTLGCRYPKL